MKDNLFRSCGNVQVTVSVKYPGWYIDDVGFSIVSWANVYDQTMTIPSIDSYSDQ